jgi:catechol 2,3-dioxygenase-like lactoylglutathione lyase family enzyme
MENKFTEITQIGLIVSDREKTIENMRAVFGAEPTQIVRTLKSEHNQYRGLPGDFEAELIFYRFANIEIEFIVPLSGESIWREHIDAGAEGLHHILFNVDSFEGAKEQMAGQDIGVTQQGLSVMGVPGLKWAYFDTAEKLSFIVEMKNAKEILKE